MPKIKKPKHHALKVGMAYRTRDGGRAVIISTTNKLYGDGLPIIAHKESIGYAPPYTMGRNGLVYPDGVLPVPAPNRFGAAPPSAEHQWDIIDATPISAVQFR